MESKLPSVSDHMDSPLATYITITANDCGYVGMEEELIVNYAHQCFWRLSHPQVKRTILIGVRPQLDHFLTIIGKK